MLRALVLFALVALLPAVAVADDLKSFDFGGDQFVSGQSPALSAPAHDAFLAGGSVNLGQPVSGNAHMLGMNVNADAAVTGSLYAAGFSIEVTAPVGGAVTAAGNNVTVKAPATVGGNARLAGATITLAAPVAGSALVSGRSLSLTSAVAGDLDFYGEDMTFGPDAKVNGTLSIHAPKPITVPESVASPDRVKYEVLTNPDIATQTGGTARNLVGSFWPAAWAMVSWWVLLFVVGALLIVLAPHSYGATREVAAHRPWRNIGAGILAFAAAIGLIAVLAMTIVGIVLIPVDVLLIAVFCVLGYIVGTYFVTLKVASGLTRVDSNAGRLGVLAGGLVIAGVLSLIPVVGWLVSLVLTLFGMGVIAVAIFNRPPAAAAADGPTAPPASAQPVT